MSNATCSMLPEIMIEDTILTPTPEPTPVTISASEHLVQQLPVIRNWVPKAESLFAELLDSRSPQVYRRTDSTSKTASYPQSLQPGNIKGSRSSWPGVSDTNDESIEIHESERQAEDDSKIHPVQFKKSPALFRKCTSFDLERAKPFPSRSSAKSPLPLRKGGSLEERVVGSTVSLGDSPKSERKMGQILMAAPEKIEEESFEDKLEVPVCTSESSVIHKIAEVTNIFSKIVQIDSHPKSHTPQVATQKSLHEMFSQPKGDPDVVFTLDPLPLDDEFSDDVTQSEDSGVQISPDVGGARKSVSSSSGGRRPSVPKTVAGGKSGKEHKHATKSHCGPIMGKAGLKPIKKEGFFSGSGSPKTSAVRTALMTSAARLKAIGRKSPVTLLSYRTDSINVPAGDRKLKKDRPSSEPTPKSSHSRQQKTSSTSETISTVHHQTTPPKTEIPEFKPETSQKATLSMTVSSPKTDRPRDVKPKTSTPKLSPRLSVSPQPVTLSVQGMRRSSTPRSTISVVSGSASSTPRGATAVETNPKSKQQDSVSVVLRTSRASSRSPLTVNGSGKDKKTIVIGKASGGSRIQVSSPEVRESRKAGETKSKATDVQNRPRTEKQDSTGSVQSQCSQKSDHSSSQSRKKKISK